MNKNSKEQDDIYYSINNEIARIRGKDDMLHLIRNTLKEHINFDDSFILRYNKEFKTFRAYIFHVEEDRSNNPDFMSQLDMEYPVDDRLRPAHNIPIVQNVDIVLSSGNKQVSFIHDAGIKEFVILNLIERNELIGFLVLLSERKNSFTNDALHLLQKISYPIAIATANIMANEEISKREEEKTLLLSLSNEIAALKSREDLFHVVNTKIKNLFSVEEFGIAQIDEGGETYSAFTLEFGDKTKSFEEFDAVTSARYSVTDPIFTKVVNAEDPVLFDVEEVAELPEMPDYVSFWKKAGHKYYVHAPLRVGGVIIGFVTFHYSNYPVIDLKSILFKGVCAQLAVAVSNILASEKILARDYEKTILLSLSNEIAAIKNREDFFSVVNDKIRNLLNISDFGFSSIDEGGKTFKAFVMDVGEKFKSHSDYQKTIDSSFDVSDPLFTEVLNSENPVLYVVDELAKRPDMPPYVNFWINSGIQKVLIVALRVGGKAIGTAIFIIDNDAKVDSKSNLLKGICSQLAVAISNILANERIKAREEEKTRLLEFSNAMASVRDKAILAKILKKQLKNLFGIEDYVIHALSGDKKTHRPVLFDPDTDFAQHPDFQKLIYVDTPVEDGVFNKILASDDLVTFNALEWINSPDAPTYSKAAEAINLQRMGGISIRLGKEKIAVMNFRMEGIDSFAIKRPLFKSVCSQIAIAISNILANDKVNQQLIEIEEYKRQLEEEKIYLQEEIETTHNYSEIVGQSPAIKKVLNLVTKVAGTDTTVLLQGETGTGKELIARAIHNASPRKNKLMIKVNCAAMPANLIESELFGHEKGSFTGAFERRAGKFELANNGTLFLDEIGEMPLELQVKLLRALQEKEIERIGGRTTIRTDVRVIAATNRNLERMMEEGTFRNDLYYRLNIFPIRLPALRERKEDIPLLASFFIMRYAKKEGKKITKLSNRVLQEIESYAWPGNIRELEHWVERSVLLSTGNTIKDSALPDKSLKSKGGDESFKIRTIFENEKEYILKVLSSVNGRISGEGGAAELLGIPPSTLNSRMKKLGIRRDHHG